jgi:hypothetical protein
MGFERAAAIALITSQEHKGRPIKSLEEAFELLEKGEYGYKHDFKFKSGVERILPGQMNPICAICGGEPKEHQDFMAAG